MRITLPRVLLIVAALLTGLILQTTLLSRLGLPGATPDLVLVTVLVLAMAAGPGPGAVIGFGAGVLVDVAPPATGSIGQTAAVYAIAAFVAGHFTLDAGAFDLRSALAIAGLTAGVTFALSVTGALLSSPHVTWSAVPWFVVTAAVYAAVLALAVVPIIGVLYRGAADEGRLA